MLRLSPHPCQPSPLNSLVVAARHPLPPCASLLMQFRLMIPINACFTGSSHKAILIQGLRQERSVVEPPLLPMLPSKCHVSFSSQRKALDLAFGKIFEGRALLSPPPPPVATRAVGAWDNLGGKGHGSVSGLSSLWGIWGRAQPSQCRQGPSCPGPPLPYPTRVAEILQSASLHEILINSEGPESQTRQFPLPPCARGTLRAINSQLS